MITFDEQKHEYKLDGRVLLSCTQLLKKHGLSADYSAINEEVLAAKAQRGTLVHKQLETYIKTCNKGFAGEVEQYIAWATRKRADALESEQIVHNDIIAGTLDLCGKIGDRPFVADFKTSASLDREGVRWQLSLYAYLKGLLGNCDLRVLHFPTENELKDVPVQPIATAEIERLIECERRGEIYTKPQLIVAEDLALRVEQAELAIKQIEYQKKQAEAFAQQFRDQMLALMEAQDIKSYELPGGTKITRVDATTSMLLDKDKVKKILTAEQFASCEKISHKSAYIKITLPKTEGNDND